MGRPARLQHEIERVREEILHAAARAFSQQGFDRVTIHDIAKEAGYTTPSLYAYFKGKQEIIDALGAALSDEFGRAYAADMPRELTFEQRLTFLFDRLADIAERWPEVPLLMLEAKRMGTARFKAHGHGSKKSMDVKLVEWLQRNATGPHDLGGHDPAEIAYLLRSLIVGTFLPNECGASQAVNPSTRDRFALTVQVCLHGLAGLKPRRGPP